MPGFIPPQLATLKLKPPAGDQWIHEIKYDGYRLQPHLSKGRARAFTCGGLDWTKKFRLIADAFEGLPIERAIFDGEACVVKNGRTDFGALQAELAAGRQGALEFHVFDLLYLDGFDLRKSPQIERKRILEMPFAEAGAQKPLIYSQHLVTDPNEMFAAACKMKWEGIISKRADAPYGSDRNEGWLKIKCSQRGKFPVVGLIKDPGGIAALYLGKRERRELRYVGKVGTGFSRAVSADLRRKLDGLVTPKTKLTGKVNKPKATWVDPQLIAEVEYRDVTDEGYLRHSSFKGLAKPRN